MRFKITILLLFFNNFVFSSEVIQKDLDQKVQNDNESSDKFVLDKKILKIDRHEDDSMKSYTAVLDGGSLLICNFSKNTSSKTCIFFTFDCNREVNQFVNDEYFDLLQKYYENK